MTHDWSLEIDVLAWSSPVVPQLSTTISHHGIRNVRPERGAGFSLLKPQSSQDMSRGGGYSGLELLPPGSW